jgi:hypothetical protein
MDREQRRTDVRLRPRDQEARCLGAVADTWGHRQVQMYMYMVNRVDRVKTAVKQVKRRLWKTWQRS